MLPLGKQRRKKIVLAPQKQPQRGIVLNAIKDHEKQVLQLPVHTKNIFWPEKHFSDYFFLINFEPLFCQITFLPLW